MTLRDVKIVFQDVDGCMNTPDNSDLSEGPGGGLTGEQLVLLAQIGRAHGHAGRPGPTLG